MARPAGSRNKPKVAYYCDECGETGFATKKCPGCGNLQTLELNKDGIPMTEIQNAIGAPPQMPIILGGASEFMDPNAEMKKLVSDEQSQAIAEMNLDKVKAKAAEAKAERIRTEEELALTEKGFRKPRETEETPDPMTQQQRTIGMDPSMLLNGIGKWSDEARNDLFDRLASDDDFALNWSRAFNSMPQQQMPMNAQQMMNPWMNPMMMGQQSQVPQEPQESAASMMTAMIAAVAQLKELSGGNDDGGSAAMDRMMDRMEHMEERAAERDSAMQQRILEMQQNQGNNQVSPQDVQAMIHSTIANSSTDQLAASITSIKGVVDGLSELGVVKRSDVDANNIKDDFERMKWKDEVDLKRESRDREDAREERAADLELSRQAAEMSVMGLLLNSNQPTETDDSDDDETDEEAPVLNPIQRVIS